MVCDEPGDESVGSVVGVDSPVVTLLSSTPVTATARGLRLAVISVGGGDCAVR